MIYDEALKAYEKDDKIRLLLRLLLRLISLLRILWPLCDRYGCCSCL